MTEITVLQSWSQQPEKSVVKRIVLVSFNFEGWLHHIDYVDVLIHCYISTGH